MINYINGKFVADNGEGRFELDSPAALHYIVDRYIELLMEETDNKEDKRTRRQENKNLILRNSTP